MKPDIFEKPYIKSPGFQQRIDEELSRRPNATSAEIAESIFDWFMDVGRGVQTEILSYAVSHMRGNVKRKRDPKTAAERRKRGEAEAQRLIRLDRAKWLLNLTYDRLSLVVDLGPTLQAKMQPGQKVSDVWSLQKVMRLMK